jgi:hypothetical protein
MEEIGRFPFRGSCDREAVAFRDVPPPKAGDQAMGFRFCGIPLAS